MTSKSRRPKKRRGRKAPAAKPTPNVQVPQRSTPEDRKLGAALINRPAFQAARLVRVYQPAVCDGAGDDFTPRIEELTAELQQQATTVQDGDLRRAESMLMSQAHALQAIFAHFGERAKNAETWEGLQTMMGLALKAQSQCRATLETLVEVKFPRQTQFVRQQNVAMNQQVNNGAGESRARGETLESTTELLGRTDGVDTAKTGAAGTAHQGMAPLASVDRS